MELESDITDREVLSRVIHKVQIGKKRWTKESGL